jgi:uncharacterized radical SAM superfamily protein
MRPNGKYREALDRQVLMQGLVDIIVKPHRKAIIGMDVEVQRGCCVFANR